MCRMTARLCLLPGCRDIGEHAEDCAGGRCRGCRPRICEHGLVCNSCRVGLAAEVAEIGDLDRELTAPQDPVDHREDWERRPVPTTDVRELRPWCWVRVAGRGGDVLALLVPMGFTPSASSGARVSGTPERSAPVSLDRLDLTAAPRMPNLTAQGRAYLHDQIGELPAGTVLGLWVRDWIDVRGLGEHAPVPTVPALVSWLAVRLPWACDGHPAVDEFATEVRNLRQAMRGQAGLADVPPEKCHGVTCRSCDRLNVIYRDGGVVSCKSCGLYYSDKEYRSWTKLLGADAKQRVLDGELCSIDPETEQPKRGTKPMVLVAFPDWVEDQ